MRSDARKRTAEPTDLARVRRTDDTEAYWRDRAERAEAELVEIMPGAPNVETAAEWASDRVETIGNLSAAYGREKKRADQARADCAALREGIEALADEWRYKGEFGWGPWQEGYGPDIEGHILDDAAARLRALLAAHPGRDTAPDDEGGGE